MVDRRFKDNQSQDEFTDRIIHLNRVAKVVKGGRRFSFSAVVVVGDGNGRVGIGKGKAREVPEAIRKGSEQAKRNLIQVPLVNETIPHAVEARFGSAKVVLKPASPGTGIIAGSAVRLILEAAGIPNILSKIIGSRNPHNVSKATMIGLQNLTTIEEYANKLGRSKEEFIES